MVHWFIVYSLTIQLSMSQLLSVFCSLLSSPRPRLRQEKQSCLCHLLDKHDGRKRKDQIGKLEDFQPFFSFKVWPSFFGPFLTRYCRFPENGQTCLTDVFQVVSWYILVLQRHIVCSVWSVLRLQSEFYCSFYCSLCKRNQLTKKREITLRGYSTYQDRRKRALYRFILILNFGITAVGSIFALKFPQITYDLAYLPVGKPLVHE